MGFRGKHANRRDANEGEIADTFRAHGCTVERVDQPVDLIIGYRGKSYLVEVKSPKGTLNEKQRKWAAHWRGDLHIVRTSEEAADLIGEWGNNG